MGYTDILTLKLPTDLQFKERVGNEILLQVNSRKVIEEKRKKEKVTFGENTVRTYDDTGINKNDVEDTNTDVDGSKLNSMDGVVRMGTYDEEKANEHGNKSTSDFT